MQDKNRCQSNGNVLRQKFSFNPSTTGKKLVLIVLYYLNMFQQGGNDI